MLFCVGKEYLNNKVISSTDLKKALTYSVNQEKYLRVFLESAIIPLDNNDEQERSIKNSAWETQLAHHRLQKEKGARQVQSCILLQKQRKLMG